MYSSASILLTRGLSSTTISTSRVLWLRRQSTRTDSFLNSAAETISSLRWRIATSLTESLSKDEQQQLLQRLKVVEPTTPSKDDREEEVDDEHFQKSIAEAVAQARADEAKTQTAKWEREKDRLKAELEEAATKRVENELLIQHRKLAFEKWQREVQNSTTSSNETAATTTTMNGEATAEAGTATSEEDHPVLGKAIVDLGYKRIHTASVQVLKSLPVWKKQRTYRHKRAESMAQDKMKTLHLGMPGIIALHEDKDGSLSIVDGQHRVGMLAILEEKKNDSIFNLDEILCEVFVEHESSKSTDDHAQEIFLEINKAEPVKLVDLPGINLTKVDRKTINEGAQRLEEAYPQMFSSSQRCRPPHLNIDNLREALFQSDIVKRHNLKSPKAMVEFLLQQNERLKEEFLKEGSAKAAGVSKTALDKAIKFDFFLGLDSTWLLA